MVSTYRVEATRRPNTIGANAAMTDVEILESVRTHWRDLRGRTYDLMDALGDADQEARLPFAESQDVLYQLRFIRGCSPSGRYGRRWRPQTSGWTRP